LLLLQSNACPFELPLQVEDAVAGTSPQGGSALSPQLLSQAAAAPVQRPSLDQSYLLSEAQKAMFPRAAHTPVVSVQLIYSLHFVALPFGH
jgi:hypothetical protein